MGGCDGVVAVGVPVTPFLLAITGAAWIVRGVVGLASPTYYAGIAFFVLAWERLRRDR